MPYVQIRTTEELTKEKIVEIKNELSPAISLIPGKSEAALMFEIVCGCSIFMRGDDSAPSAYVSVLVNNDQKPEDLRVYSKKICEVLADKAGIPMDRIYITHDSLPVWHSGRAFAAK